MDGGIDAAADAHVFQSDQGLDGNSEWHLPDPVYSHADYLEMASRLCSPDGDRSKKVFSFQNDSYHLSFQPVAFRNGEGQYFFVNETCEAWMLAPTLAKTYLQMPMYRQLDVNEFANVLERVRALEFGDFGRLGFTRLYPVADFLYFEVEGHDVALGVDYQQSYINMATGQLWPEVADIPFADYELLALAVLQYRFWDDEELLADAVPYRGERLWVSLVEQRQVTSAENLTRDWPLTASPDELGLVGPNGCTHYGKVTGEDAEALRAVRDEVLALPPKDSKGHFAIGVRFGGKKYWMWTAEGFPLEDEDGWIPWMDIRMQDVPCTE
ncbi:MAG: hypothetical protein R3E66_06405 [bacterium]